MNTALNIAEYLTSQLSPEQVDALLGSEMYSQYQDDPVGFGENILGDEYTDDVKVLMESVRDNVITVAKSANATGKTHSAARIGMWFYKCFEGSQVYTAAAPPESNLKKLLWGEIGSVVEDNPNIFSSDTTTNLHVSRSAQSFVTGVTIPMSGTESQREAKFSGKHAPYLLFILDEADAIPDEVYKGIESCMSGGHARLLVMFNPRSEMGPVYRMERDGRANIVELSAFNHPNVITGEDRIPGAVTRDTTVRRINEWCRRLTGREEFDSECFELPDFLVSKTAKSPAGYDYPELRPGNYKVMESAFSYMVLGKYPAQGSTQLISREWIAKARSRWDLYVAEYGEVPPKGVSGVMGLDIAEFGDDANCSCCRYGGYVEQITTWSGVDTVKTGDRGAEEYKSRDITQANIDATGIGAGVAPQMKREKCNAIPVKVANSPTRTTELGEFKIMRDQLWWACREWLRIDPGSMLPPDEELIEELATPTYKAGDDGKLRVMKKDDMKDKLKRSPDRADALCLTFYAPNLLFPGLGG